MSEGVCIFGLLTVNSVNPPSEISPSRPLLLM